MSKDEKSIVAVLEEIIETYGTDIFKEHKRLCALLADMASGDCRKKERRRVKMALESGAIDVLLKTLNDKKAYELYINESVSRLVSQTDMADDLARETILTIAEALSLNQTKTIAKTEEKPQNKYENKTSTKKTDVKINKAKKEPVILTIAITTSMLSVATLIFSIFFAEQPLKAWLIGIASGIILTEITIALAYILQEFILFNEMCQTITIAIPVLLVTNIVLRIFLGDTVYELIFNILTVFIFIGSVANAILTRIDYEDKWTLPNIILAVCSAFLFFIWPGAFSWTVWQWIIGIGGGLFLAGVVFAIVEILDTIGPERFASLTVILIILTIVNFILLFTFGESYLIIAQCYMAMLTIGSIIASVMSFREISSGFGFFNIILTLLNGGIFVFLIFGSYEQLTSTIELMLDKIKL